jgi:DNA-binding GntR family transcriptional regulator
MAEKDAAKAAGARWDWAMRAWFAPPRNLMDAAESREPSSLDHVPIYEAIEIKDDTAAVAAMATHMEGATCRLRAAMAAHGTPCRRQRRVNWSFDAG